LSVLMMLGLPAPLANGTNRIAITIQTLVATTSFKQQKVLETKKASKKYLKLKRPFYFQYLQY